MKVNKNNVTYFWASVCIWILGCLIFGWTLPKSNTGVIIAVVLYLLPVIPLVMLFKYYRHDPDGIKAQKEADENYKYKYLVKQCKKLDKKIYKPEDKPDKNIGCLPMN